MTISDESILDVVGEVYAAALTPTALPGALERISDAFGGAGINTAVQRLPEGMNSPCFVRLDADRMAAFQRDYGSMNADINAKLAGPVWPDLLQRSEIVDDAEYARSAIYSELIRPQGLREFALATLARGPGYVALLTINLPERRGPFDDSELELLRRLLPHLQQAKRLELRLAALAASNSALLQGLDRLAQGAILVDGEARVVAHNAAAETILRSGDGLAVHSGKLRAVGHKETQRLLALIAAASATATRRGTSGGGGLALARPSLRRPLQLAVYPLAPGEHTEPPGRATAMVFVADPEDTSGPEELLLAGLYGLTAAEASLVARLAEGLDMSEICARLRISMPTARTHLAHILAKTGTHRQAELLRLILRGPAGLRAREL